HTPIFSCHCEDCTKDCENGCENPQKCAIEAQRHIEKLVPKLNPRAQMHQDNLSLTRRRLKNNKVAREENKEITFNPSVTEKTSITNCFRAFVDPEKTSNVPTERQQPVRGVIIPKEQMTIYTDGSCISCMHNGKANAKAGAGVWFTKEDEQNKALKIPGSAQMNQVGELVAVIAALKNFPMYAPLTIVLD
ncbi:hypothetical protein EI94DRAFT_1451418, partial [Lactarius quietus]